MPASKSKIKTGSSGAVGSTEEVTDSGTVDTTSNPNEELGTESSRRTEIVSSKDARRIVTDSTSSGTELPSCIKGAGCTQPTWIADVAPQAADERWPNRFEQTDDRISGTDC